MCCTTDLQTSIKSCLSSFQAIFVEVVIVDCELHGSSPAQRHVCQRHRLLCTLLPHDHNATDVTSTPIAVERVGPFTCREMLALVEGVARSASPFSG